MPGVKGRSGAPGKTRKAGPGRPPILAGSDVIQLRTPLPCSIRNFDNESDICGKPATVAHCWPHEPDGLWATPGLWTLQPVCRECAAAAAKVYE
jgi:hypothetical protein